MRLSKANGDVLMFNQPSEWDKGFKKGLEIGQKIGFFESKMQSISKELSNISEELTNQSTKSSVIFELDGCIERLDDALEQITNL